MMFIQLGVKQNDNSTLCIFGNWFLSPSYGKNICYQRKPTIQFYNLWLKKLTKFAEIVDKKNINRYAFKNK